MEGHHHQLVVPARYRWFRSEGPVRTTERGISARRHWRFELSERRSPKFVLTAVKSLSDDQRL
jgi:hypothetical protein